MAAVKEFLLGDTTAGEFNCSKHLTGAKKNLSIKFNQTVAANHGKWPLRIQFQRFGANLADRWPRWTGARLIEVHLHSKSFGETLKWPLKGGSRLIQVTATAGLTVYGMK